MASQPEGARHPRNYEKAIDEGISVITHIYVNEIIQTSRKKTF